MKSVNLWKVWRWAIFWAEKNSWIALPHVGHVDPVPTRQEIVEDEKNFVVNVVTGMDTVQKYASGNLECVTIVD